MLRGRVALVTGVSRRAGIGYAIAQRLADQGAELFVHHYAPHDSEQPWGADSSLPLASLPNASVDLADPAGPQRLMDAAIAAYGHVDILVCNHALSGSDGSLGELDAAMLDKHYAVNTRSTILLTQAFAAQHDGRPGGRVVFMTSGQDLGPMRNEVAYAAAKGALASISRTLADHLADQRITLNTVNPGPVDTGWASPELLESIRPQFPQGRWGTPDDAARLIAFLVSDDAAWITGQVINSDGGVRPA
ncbi:3-ketoacyl-ACP reductase [Kibdelosporangium aridum]|uniref:3-ketoacyl-ACP reductase n=1 Tax=Kibdelosporangium aridum TaxID=2030 RepID=A0A428ZUA2_KIBAR|nr:SDR family oxidoreductase [Kibdelosporangium aridum]RSM91650.1 3-ketoacyl-ACP reductase [Kibdelosporangium aridum]